MRLAVIEPLPFGGLLHYSTQLADALADLGHSVDLIVAHDNELATLSGPATRRCVLPPNVKQAPETPTPAEFFVRRLRTARRLVRTWMTIAREACSGRYDVVLLNSSFDMPLNAAGGLLVTMLRGRTPLALVCHNVRPFNRWGGENVYVDSRLTMGLLRRLYPRFDLVFVHGEKSKQEFEQTWPPTPLAVVPHGNEGLFADEPPAPGDEARVLFFGAWRKMKGLPYLMEAFDLLAARRPEARLTLAGETMPEEGESERVLAWAADRADRVEVRPGYVAIEDVKSLFARARVVAMPYVAGYQSGVAHVAMTMGRAIVATDVGDLPSAVEDGETGFVVPARDAAAFADALERVLEDPSLAARLGAAGRARALASSSWAAVAEQVEAGLQDLVGRS